MRKYLLLLIVTHSMIASAQNVGVGTATPTEKLDVNGNINVAGTIKTNGTDGTPGQVLMKNNSGSLVWGDMCEYKNLVTFTSTGASSWVVPANVTRILIEVWGAGGGGNIYAAGGGGGYIRAIFTVAPGGTIFNSIGALGPGATTTATNGGESSVAYLGNSVIAGGGFGANFSAPFVFAGYGGGFVSFGIPSFFGINGQRGQPVTNVFQQTTTSVFYEMVTGGYGGNSGNTGNTGGEPSYVVAKATAPVGLIKALPGKTGNAPGGGGSSGYSFITSGVGFGNGYDGANGMVIIHY